MNNTNSDRISIEKNKRNLFTELKKDIEGPLKNSDIRSNDIYNLAIAFGYKNKVRMPISSKDRFIRKETFGKSLNAIIYSLAISNSKENIDILSEDYDKKYLVAEEFANGGIDFLSNSYKRDVDKFVNQLRLEISTLNKDDKILNKLKEMGIEYN